MKFRTIYLLAVLPLIVGVTMPFAIANPSHMLAQGMEEKSDRWEEFKAGRRQKMIETLNLSDDQVQQLEAIWGEEKSSAKDNYDAIKTEMEAMSTLVSESASAAELRSQHQKIQALRQEMSTARFEQMLKMYEILTPEQRKTFAEKMKMHRHGKGHFGQRRHRGGQSGELQSLLVF